jgi:hypothetical protein
MSLALLHDFLANSVLMYTIILCLWGFWRVLRKQNLNGSYQGSVVIAEILFLIQGLLGGFLWLINSLRPERGGIHILYGVVGVLGIPAVFLFTKGRDGRREMILYAAVMLFNSGIFLRAIATGG